MISFFFAITFFFKNLFILRCSFFFFIVLALITIDLGAALTLVVFDGSVKDCGYGTSSKLGSCTKSLFKSVGEGSFLRFSDFL